MESEEKRKLVLGTENLIELKNEKSFNLFRKSTTHLTPSRKRFVFLLLMFLFMVIFLKKVIFLNKSAIYVISDITINLNTIIIPIFAVLITGYAIFQALANKQTTIMMLKVLDKNDISKLVTYNLYFYGIVFLYLFTIIFNFILLIIFKYSPEDSQFFLFSTNINEWIASLLISLYLTYILHILTEVKSFVYNLFQVFLTNLSSTAIEKIKDEKDDNDS